MSEHPETFAAKLDRRAAEMHVEMHADLLKDIVEFCEQHNITTAEFGRQALNDRGFCSRLRNSKTGLKLETQARVDAFMEIGPDPEGFKSKRLGRRLPKLSSAPRKNVRQRVPGGRKSVSSLPS